MKNLMIVLAVLLTFPMMSQEKIQPLVNVTGEGIVKIVPDQVTINLTVENTGKELIPVKNENDTAVDAVLKQLKQMGIQEKDIQTQRVNLNKNYDYNTKEYQFRASQSITVLLRDLNKYDALITELLTKGLNRIDGINFGSSKMDDLLRQARVKAIHNAKEKATEYAGALNQKIGKAIQIQEPGQNYNPVPVYRAFKMESFDASGNQTLAVGELEITTSVIVAFELF